MLLDRRAVGCSPSEQEAILSTVSNPLLCASISLPPTLLVVFNIFGRGASCPQNSVP